MSRFTLDQLRVFLAALASGSVTGAAVELDLAQSTTSSALSEFERALGATLLERGRFGVRPTAVGTQVARYARAVLQAAEALEQSVQLERGDLRGRLRVAAYRSLATHLLPDLITLFRERHPGVEFEVQSMEGEAHGLEHALLGGAADLCLLSGPVYPSLESVDFAADDWVAVFPLASAPAAKHASWSDLQRLPFLLCNDAGAPTVRRYWHHHGQHFQQVAQVEDDSVILAMVEHGFGCSILARLATLPLPGGIAVRALPTALERRLSIAFLPQMQLMPVFSAFLGHIRDPLVLERCTVVREGALRTLPVAQYGE